MRSVNTLIATSISARVNAGFPRCAECTSQYRSNAANVSTKPAGGVTAGSTKAGQVIFRLTKVGANTPSGPVGNVIITRNRGAAFGFAGVTTLPWSST